MVYMKTDKQQAQCGQYFLEVNEMEQIRVSKSTAPYSRKILYES